MTFRGIVGLLACLALGSCGLGRGADDAASVPQVEIRAEHPVRSPGAPPETAPDGLQFDPASLEPSLDEGAGEALARSTEPDESLSPPSAPDG